MKSKDLKNQNEVAICLAKQKKPNWIKRTGGKQQKAVGRDNYTRIWVVGLCWRHFKSTKNAIREHEMMFETEKT